MKRVRVRLSRKGVEYLHNPHCSSVVGEILRSINSFSAEVLEIDESIVRVKLPDSSPVVNSLKQNSFTVHRDHLTIL